MSSFEGTRGVSSSAEEFQATSRKLRADQREFDDVAEQHPGLALSWTELQPSHRPDPEERPPHTADRGRKSRTRGLIQICAQNDGHTKSVSKQERVGRGLSRAEKEGKSPMSVHFRSPQQGGQSIPGAPVNTELLLIFHHWGQMVLAPQTRRRACNMKGSKGELDPHPS